MGLTFKTDWCMTPDLALNLRGRAGGAGGEFQGGAAAGLDYRFGR
jgi:hypothetical protein